MTNDLPKGFRAGTAAANFKKAGRDDLGLIVSDRPCMLAGMFTQNLFKAAPVLVCQEILASRGTARAVLANAGQANACTGEEGLANCRATQKMAAEAAGLDARDILPISTGVIGAHLRMDLWRAAVPALIQSLGSRDAEGFTRAFMTTDAFPKFASREVMLSGGGVRLTVMAKGAGMICPNMATMLSLVMCDAAVDPEAWRSMFRRAVNSTFNRVSVDGDTSTNDSLFGLANGASGVRAESPDDRAVLEEALTGVLGDLAYMLVRDGEGATKVMHIRVSGAASDADAEAVARAVGHSQLVKTAMFGRDPNWGRIVAAAGRAGVNFRPEDLRVVLCGVELFRDGRPTDRDFDALLREPLEGVDIDLELTLGEGPGSSRLLASDLSHAYVSLNADYRS